MLTMMPKSLCGRSMSRLRDAALPRRSLDVRLSPIHEPPAAIAQGQFLEFTPSGWADLTRIRNIGIIAHVDAGKTTTYVDEGDTVLDFLDLERERGITINSAAITFSWRKHTINLIDTPGHVDFTAEVERAVRVLDGAVTILDAVSGVQSQTETVWRQADRYNIPRVVYINKMDREGVSYQQSVTSIRDRLYVEPLLIQLPVGHARQFHAVIDLVTMELVQWNDELAGAEVIRIPVENTPHSESAANSRRALLEKLANYDEIVMDAMLSENEVSADELKTALRRVTLTRQAVVVLFGSSLKNKGVQPVLDAVVDFLPSPLESAALEAVDDKEKPVSLTADPSAELAALAFKVVHDDRKGLIIYFRVYSGTLVAGAKLKNSRTGDVLRPLKLVRVSADDYEDVKQVAAGGIGAALGLKNTRTGDTLVSPQSSSIAFKGVLFPAPVFSCSVVPQSSAGEAALNAALAHLQLEDPSVRVTTNKETGQMLLSGMGELHLEILQDRILNHYKADAQFGPIYIAYRSTISQNVSHFNYKGTFTAGGGRQEEIALTISLSHDESDEPRNVFTRDGAKGISAIPNKAVANEVVQALMEGCEDSFTTGYPSGFPFHDLHVKLEELTFVPGAPPNLYRFALVQAINAAAKHASPVILEPLMRLSMQVDAAHLRPLLADLSNKRRGTVVSLNQNKHIASLEAEAPLRELLGYSNDLRSFTKGTGFFSMELINYRAPMLNVQRQILEEHGLFNFL